MPELIQNCACCGKSVIRKLNRVNENKKCGWKTYCSQKCLTSNRTLRKKFVCSREGCLNTFFRLPKDAKKSIKFYCSTSCAAKVNNLKRTKTIKVCPNCGKDFIGDKKYCSLACVLKHQSKYTSEIVTGEIRHFYELHSRIPVKREMYAIYKVARKYFGTWNNAIKTAGFNPNPVMFAKKYVANDGHRCDSLAEKIIDDYLYARKIVHKRQVHYHNNPKFTCDFVVGNIWIEFFGLSGQLKRYDELKKQKMKLIKDSKLKFIKIYPHDLFPKNHLTEKLYSIL